MCSFKFAIWDPKKTFCNIFDSVVVKYNCVMDQDALPIYPITLAEWTYILTKNMYRT